MKKVLSALLALCLLLGTLPVLAGAKGINRYEETLNRLIAERVGSSKQDNSGLYYDLNGDGIEEMVIVRKKKTSDGFTTVNVSLFAVVDGAAECLLKDEELYIEVGGPTAKVQVVTKGGKTYLAVCSEGGETSGIHHRCNGTWKLYAMDAATDTLKKVSSVSYTVYRGYTYNDNKVYLNESFATIDGKRVSWTAYEAWVKTMTVKADIDIGMSALISKKNQTFEQLLKKAKADTTGDLPVTSVAGFRDVKVGAYYADAVSWAVEKGITAGKGTKTFKPDDSCTRGEIVTFLWRSAGSPEPSSTGSSFRDVKPGDYYYKAMLWAVENKITSGRSATSFDPSGKCTRGEAVTFMWRAEKEPLVQGAGAFKDVAKGSFYENAVNWAVKNGITAGKGSGTFKPGDKCTRAEIVSFLFRGKDL